MMEKSKAALTFQIWGFAVHACPVKMSERQRFVNPMSGLLFCTTCCLAQPCLERRGGREEMARQEMICHQWFVTMLHQIPLVFFFCFFLFWSQLVIPGVGCLSENGPRPELAESWFGHKGKFGQRVDFASSSLCSCRDHLDFFAVFVYQGG